MATINGTFNSLIAGSLSGTVATPGSQGPVGPVGPTGPQGAQGPIGPQGVQGIQGVIGPQGVKGDTGETGPQGAQGIQGVIGPQGATGATGATGPTGPQGPQGIQGPTGPTGPQGSQGVQGIAGDKFATTSTSTLTVGNGSKTLTVGTALAYSTQQSVIVAHDNDHHMHGDVTSYSPITGVMVVAVNKHTGSGTFSSWTVNLEGAAGIQGPQGIQGETGATGPAGPTGPQGATGPQGDTGATGPQGDQGIQGEQGPQGPQGDTGATGADGSQGVQGPQGEQGPQGATGVGVPTGGTAGMVLAKVDGTDYNTHWVTGGGGGSWSGGTITSPIYYPSGNDTASFLSYVIDVTKTEADGALPRRTTNLNADRLLVSYTYDDYGVERTYNASYNHKGFYSNFNDSFTGYSLDVGQTNTPNISGQVTSYLGSESYSITVSGISFISPSASYAATFGIGGIQFSNGTTQTTAASPSPSSSNAVWYSGGWYSANVSTVFDTSSNYINVLSF